jgi:hypothetical protein
VSAHSHVTGTVVHFTYKGIIRICQVYQSRVPVRQNLCRGDSPCCSSVSPAARTLVFFQDSPAVGSLVYCFQPHPVSGLSTWFSVSLAVCTPWFWSPATPSVCPIDVVRSHAPCLPLRAFLKPCPVSAHLDTHIMQLRCSQVHNAHLFSQRGYYLHTRSHVLMPLRRGFVRTNMGVAMPHQNSRTATL